MTISAARGLASTDIRCPDCHKVRTVDARHARRWREGHEPGLCASCRGGSATRKARDRDYAFWLKQFGVPVPRGTRAMDVIAASGVPPALGEFAKRCYPD